VRMRVCIGGTGRAMILLAWLAGSSPCPGGPVTFPASPSEILPAEEAEQKARVSLFEGRPEEALRLLLTAGPQRGGEPSYARLLALDYLALEYPMRAVEALALGGGQEREMAALLLRRQAPEAPRAPFRFERGTWPEITKETLKEKAPRGVLASPDGTLWLMGKERLWHLSPEGKTLATVSLPGAQDLCPDFDGGPVALGSRQVLWRGKVLALPGEVAKPVSAAESPDGRLLILDGKTSSLFRIGTSGQVESRSTFALDSPLRVRSDGAGRVFLLDEATCCVYLYSASLSPIRILDPEARGYKLRRPRDLFVDFAGDMLLLDGRQDVAALFSAQGRFLGSSGPDDARMDALGWDGASSMVFVDRRAGIVGRAAL
jgi:hypothetical protein